MIVTEGEKLYVKSGGNTLNYHASQFVNFHVIRGIILEHGEPVVNVHTERKIKTKSNGGER